MSEFQRGAGVGVGFVRSVFSRRHGCQVVALGALVGVARVANRVSADRHNSALYEAWEADGVPPLPEGWRERVTATCADYLVSEPGPVYARPVAANSRLEFDYTTTTGGAMWWPHVRFNDDAGGPLDAPEFVAAGGMGASTGEYIGKAVRRGGEQ